MDIGTLCKHDIVSVNTSTTVGEASRVMRNNHVGALLVTDVRQPGHVVGILTDRDMVTKLLAQDGACHEQPIESLCTRRLVVLQATATSAINEATRPYSIAEAALSSARNCCRNCFMVSLLLRG